MGYWGTHPMEGDTPLDSVYAITEHLFTEEEWEDNRHWDMEEYRRRFIEKLAELPDLEYIDGFEFVLPFKVAELEVRIEDKELSRRIRGMIGDGGAEKRGYECEKEEDEKEEEGERGEGDSPALYAEALYEKWDGLMDGTISFDEIEGPMGLLETIVNKKGPGLVNVD